MYNLYFWNEGYYLSEMEEIDFILATRRVSHKGRAILEMSSIPEELVEVLMDNGVYNFDERFPNYVDHLTGI